MPLKTPNIWAFVIKRQDLGIEFFSRFQKIYFPEFEPEELKDFAIGLSECNNYIKIINNKTKNVENVKKENKEKIKIINDIMDFHINWKNNSFVEDIQCFIIREIEDVIKVIADGKSIYNTLFIIYEARCKKKRKEKLIDSFKNYKTIKWLIPETL